MIYKSGNQQGLIWNKSWRIEIEAKIIRASQYQLQTSFHATLCVDNSHKSRCSASTAFCHKNHCELGIKINNRMLFPKSLALFLVVSTGAFRLRPQRNQHRVNLLLCFNLLWFTTFRESASEIKLEKSAWTCSQIMTSKSSIILLTWEF